VLVTGPRGAGVPVAGISAGTPSGRFTRPCTSFLSWSSASPSGI